MIEKPIKEPDVRLPEINSFFEVEQCPLCSIEWDAFWMMPEEGVSFLEISPDFRKNKIRIHFETIKK